MQNHIFPKLHNVALYVLILLIFLGKFPPFHFEIIRPGLDASWQAALVDTYAKGALSGRDVVFTGGPLSALFNRAFEKNTATLVVFLSFFVVIAIATGIHKLLNGSPLAFIIFNLTLMIVLPVINDTILITIPFITLLVYLKVQKKISYFYVIPAIFIGSACVLAKFSIFPIYALTCILFDFLIVLRRQLPWLTLYGAACLVVLFLVAGQPLSALPDFVVSSLQTSSGYSSAMSLRGNSGELASWLVAASLLVATIAIDVVKGGSPDEKISGTIKLLAFSGYLFLTFKAGFVRQDLHTLISWSALALAAMLYIPTRRPVGRNRMIDIGVSTIAVFAVLHGLFLLKKESDFPLYGTPLQAVTASMKQVESLARLLISPNFWLQDYEDSQRKAIAEIRDSYPLPPLDGTVDIIPSSQSAVIAAGLDYHPRPTLQEYTTYSPSLIERNKEFFSSARAPKYLLMAPGSIDFRHPASSEGALWPLFLSRYEPTGKTQDLLILRQRSAPIQGLIGTPTTIRAKLRSEIDVPKTTDPLMVAIDIQPTIAGRLLDVAFRPPMVQLIVTYIDGTQEGYRLIPNMAREGFMLSPLITTANDFLLLALGQMDHPAWKRPKSIRVQSSSLETLAYKDDISVTFTPLSASTLASEAANNSFAKTALEQANNLERLLASNRLVASTVAVIPEGLLAHAPTKLVLPVQSGKTLLLGFGMRDGSWKEGGQTNGVCFAVKSAHATLFERCLDPRASTKDRGPQSASLTIPADTQNVTLETSCRENCAWDWSYWNKAVIQ